MDTSRKLYFSLAFFAIAFGVSQAFGIHDCCVKYDETKPSVKIIDAYSKQKSTEVCNINAIIFHVRTSPCNHSTIPVCADPRQKWVQKHIESLNQRTPKSKRRRLRKIKKRCERLRELLI